MKQRSISPSEPLGCMSAVVMRVFVVGCLVGGPGTGKDSYFRPTRGKGGVREVSMRSA